MESKGGILFFHKLAGKTSFQSLGLVKRVLGTKKVGHTGTLDKFAEGLLVLLCGPYTRLAPLISNMDKGYEALIRFGKETSTLDPEGEVIAEGPIPKLEEIERVLPSFRGKIQQSPPAYSAIHIKGQRAHSLARQGQSIEMPSREVTIHRVEILGYQEEEGLLKLGVDCSKGSYIRSLARDLARACGSRAFLQGLVRCSVGPFRLDRAVRPGDFQGAENFIPWEEVLTSLPGTEVAELNSLGAEYMSHGRPFQLRFLDSPPPVEDLLLLKKKDGALGAVLERLEGRYHYKVNLL